MNDEKILEAIKRNENRLVLRELYKMALPSISKFIQKNGGSKEDAEDCFQESVIGFITAVKKNRFNENYSILNYLYGIAKNKWYAEIKRKKHYINEEELMDTMEDEEPRIVKREHHKLLLELIQSVGESCAKLLTLVIYENKKHTEIKEILGMNNENVVKATYYRCKQKLRDKVKNTPGLKALLRNE